MRVEDIPNEVLAYVFELARPARSTSLYPVQEVVSHVSKQFRTIALSTPRLWTDVRLYSKKSLHRVREYLSRSTTCPVSITLDIYRDNRNFDESELEMDDLAEILSSNIHCLKHLVILTFDAWTYFDALKGLRDACAPLLETVTISTCPFKNPYTSFRIEELGGRILCGGAPKLHFAHISNVNAFICSLPTARLLSLTLDVSDKAIEYQIGLGELSEIAASAPLLEDLAILSSAYQSFGPLDQGLSPGQTINLKSLCALKLAGRSFLVDSLLGVLSAPNLHSLRLEMIHEGSDLLSDSEEPPVFPNLQYISVCSIPLHLFLQLHSSAPNTRSLEISYCTYGLLNVVLTTLTQGAWPKFDTLVWRTGNNLNTNSALNHRQYGLLPFMKEQRARGRPVRLLLDQDTYELVKCQPDVPSDAVIEAMTIDNYREPWFVKSHWDPSGLRLT